MIWTKLGKNYFCSKFFRRNLSLIPSNLVLPADAPSKQLLLRDYIQDHLYSQTNGYFSKHVKIGDNNKGLTEPIKFRELFDQDDFLLKLKSIYKKGAGSWLTPSEVFRPWYGYAMADHIMDIISKNKVEYSKSLEIFEIGCGSGSCMVDIMHRIKTKEHSLYDRTVYTCIEISSRLAEAQRWRAEEARLDRSRWRIINDNFLTISEELSSKGMTDHLTEHRLIVVVIGRSCFVLAFEVLDNLPHDKVIFDANGDPWEAVIIDINDKTERIRLKSPKKVVDVILSFALRERKKVKSETQIELFRKAQDSLILETLQLMHEGEAKRARRIPDEGFISLLKKYPWRYTKTGVLAQSSAVLHKQGIVYIPTGHVKFLRALRRCFPRHEAVLSDFDAIPEMVMPGAGGPAVQSIGASNRICDRSGYLLPDGVAADIFFPTDFLALRDLYEGIVGQKAEVRSAAEFFAPRKECIKNTKTMNGYCPLVEYYSNTSYLTTSGGRVS